MVNITSFENEAAFPRPTQYKEKDVDSVLLPAQWGLSKREYAAIQIMAGMGDIAGNVAGLAASAVRRADALLAELAK